ncbi:MAG: endonuclease/exonuclease/phosphatase family protein, partial [Salegentibacter sp.]
GRGFFNTFHAEHPLLRWPLDHVFHSKDFSLIEITREWSIGSDHFPIYIKLCYKPELENKQEKPEKNTQEEEEWADEKIKDAKPLEASF